MSFSGGYRQVAEDETDLESIGGNDEQYSRGQHSLRERIGIWWQTHISGPGRTKHLLSGLAAIIIVILVWSFLVSGKSPDLNPGESQPKADNWTNIRLPQWIKPKHYDLDLSTIDFEQLQFAGYVSISLIIEDPTKFVVLHSVDLNVDPEVRLVGKDLDLRPVKTDVRPQRQYTLFWFERVLPQGEYTLSLRFKGKLTDSLKGFYYSQYPTMDGKKRYIATTQFEPTDARAAFPCFDEPSLKATFQINITAPVGYHALSNMPHTSTSSLSEKSTKYVFEITPKMSTYLVAFIVSDFESIHDRTSRGVDVRVWTQPGKTNLGKYALEVSKKILEFYEGRYGIDYPLPKMDLIAIPDFAAGAMENWGLVTYRDTALVYDAKTSSAGNKQRVAEVIAHELAHQWFGNLVTMEWWNDLWLNEGFAEFMEYKGTHAAEPDWRMDDQFAVSDLLRALEADASRYTHQIAVPVRDPLEIREIFDDISYGKGSSILRMLQSWLDDAVGKDTFFHRIHDYLEAHKYGNAVTKELWDALSDDKVDVRGIMSTWTDQPGFPVVVVQDDRTVKEVVVKQERFFIAGLVNHTSEDEERQKWSVPLTFSVYGEDGKEIMSRATKVVKDLGEVKVETGVKDAEKGVVLFNAGRTGVYRVQYPEATYHRFFQLLGKDLSVFNPVDRAGLINDAFATLYAGRIASPIPYLNLTRLLATETDPIVWLTLLPDLYTLQSALVFHPSYGHLLKYQLHLLQNVIKHIGWERSDDKDRVNAHLNALLRSGVLGRAVRLGDEGTVEEATWYFEKIKNGTMRVGEGGLEADVLGVVYNAGVIWGDDDAYEWVLQRYRNETSATEQQRLLHALASTRKPYLQMRTLELALSGEVRRQDIHRLIAQTAMFSPTGHIQAWTFIRDNWSRLLSLDASSGDYTRLNNLVGAIVSRFASASMIEDAERLFVRKEGGIDVPERIEVAVRKGVERGWERVRWVEKFGGIVGEWIREVGVKDVKVVGWERNQTFAVVFLE